MFLFFFFIQSLWILVCILQWQHISVQVLSNPMKQGATVLDAAALDLELMVSERVSTTHTGARTLQS